MVDFKVGERIYCKKCSMEILECIEDCDFNNYNYKKNFKELNHGFSTSGFDLELENCCKICGCPYSLSNEYAKYEVICK